MDEVTRIYQMTFDENGNISESPVPDAVRDNEGVTLPQGAEILIEPLAEYAHTAWVEWMRWIFECATMNADGTMTLPALRVKRWQRLVQASYDDLSEIEREPDREEAREIIHVLHETLK